MEKFTDFTIMFCWNFNNFEYSILIVKDIVLDSKSNQESLDSIIKRVFNQININSFGELTLMFISDIKKTNIEILYESTNANDRTEADETIF